MTTRRRKQNKKWMLLKLGLFIYLIAGVFTIIWFRTEVVSLEYELGELNRQKTGFIREQRLIMAERASFYSVKNIEETAVKVLGMSPPERKNIYYVERTEGAVPYKVSLNKP
ncbi:MAG: cell division protein FtsL [Nitrospirae bacterium]|nr:cell division protein FtsL [Nitrospirota bacterium]